MVGAKWMSGYRVAAEGGVCPACWPTAKIPKRNMLKKRTLEASKNMHDE